MLEDPSNGLKYCMKCSPPITSTRNSNNKTGEAINNEEKLDVTTNDLISHDKQNCKTFFKDCLKDSINYMIVEVSNIGKNALNDTDLTIEKR